MTACINCSLRAGLTLVLLAFTSCYDSCSTEPKYAPPSLSFYPLFVQIVPTGTAKLFVGSTDATLALVGTPTPANITVTPQSSQITTDSKAEFTLVADSNAAPGSRDLIIVGKNGPTLQDFHVPVEVVAPFVFFSTRSIHGLAGTTISDQVPATRAEGFFAPITLSMTGQPADSVVSFPPVLRDSSELIAYTISTPSTTTPDNYPLRFKASFAGYTRTQDVTLLIDPVQPVSAHTVQLTPSAITLPRTGSAFVDVTLTRTGPPIGNIDLSIEGLPSGVTASFAPASVSGTTSRLTLSSNGAVPTATPVQLSIVATVGTQGIVTRLPLTIVADYACTILSENFSSGNAFVTTIVSQTTGSAETTERVATGGNPGEYLRMTHTLPSPSTIFVDHMFPFMYNPATLGAITYIDYREDRIQIAPAGANTAIGGGIVLKQGAARYAVPLTNGQFTATAWQTAERLNLRLADFPGIDFSAGATPIQFGFSRSNSSPAGGSQIVTTHGIDNWEVKACR